MGYARCRKSLHGPMTRPSFTLVVGHWIHNVRFMIDQLIDFWTTQSEAMIARVKMGNQYKTCTAYRNCSNHTSEPSVSRPTFPDMWELTVITRPRELIYVCVMGKATDGFQWLCTSSLLGDFPYGWNEYLSLNLVFWSLNTALCRIFPNHSDIRRIKCCFNLN